MLFGQSIFQSVVERLKEERGDRETEDTGESFRIRGLGASFVASTPEAPADIGTGTEAYFTSMADLDGLQAQHPMPEDPINIQPGDESDAERPDETLNGKKAPETDDAAAREDKLASDASLPPEPPRNISAQMGLSTTHGRASDNVPETGQMRIPARINRLSEAEIAEELAISEADSEAALNDRRRRFAKANHPDRVDPQFRDKATIRMKTANLLIDRAIRQREILARLSQR